MKNFLKKIIPKKIQPLLIKIYIGGRRVFYALIWRGSRYTCTFCNHSFDKFFSAGLSHDILKEKKIVGGGYRENAICPFCESVDRERLIHIFLKSNGLLKNQMKLLHVAPEKNLQKFFEKRNIDYFSADLNGIRAKIKMDIQDIKFPANCFDGIICNHVLEHIVDDKKAMSELYRVLKPKGWAILQVPYSPIMKRTFEDFSVVEDEERARIFGQSDHVRIYGADYLNRLKSVGFYVKEEKIDINLVKKFALNPNEVIFFCYK